MANETTVKLPRLKSGTTNDPSWLSPEITRLREEAMLAKTLMGGTKAMRAAGERYLPKMRHESTDTYSDRLKITVLRNFYLHSVQSLAGKLVRNGVGVDSTSNPPADMAKWLMDLDCCGNAADIVAKRLFIWAIRDALTFILVDYPPTIRADGSKPTLADVREQGVRPWMIPLTIWDVLGWRTERRGSRDVVTQFRYVMHSQEPDGLFGVKDVETVRVVEPTVIRDFRQNAKKNWEVIAEYANTLGRVPVQFIASDSDQSHRPRGGANELAWLNLEHWQLRSDQRLALRINSFPILFGAGMEALPPIGPQDGICAEDPTATLNYVEHQGVAIGAGRTELVDLEDAMRGMSAQYQARQVPQTATGASIESDDANSPAKGWAVNLKRGMEAAMDDMAEFAGVGSGEGAGGKLTLDTDALVSRLDSSKLAELRAARTAGEISRKAYLTALKQADVLPQDYDIERDQEEIDNEPVDETAGLNRPPRN